MNTHQILVEVFAELSEDELELVTKKIKTFTESLVDMVENSTVFVSNEDSFDT